MRLRLFSRGSLHVSPGIVGKLSSADNVLILKHTLAKTLLPAFVPAATLPLTPKTIAAHHGATIFPRAHL